MEEKNTLPSRLKKKLKFATLNVQGINAIGKGQEIERWMKKNEKTCSAYRKQR